MVCPDFNVPPEYLHCQVMNLPCWKVRMPLKQSGLGPARGKPNGVSHARRYYCAYAYASEAEDLYPYFRKSSTLRYDEPPLAGETSTTSSLNSPPRPYPHSSSSYRTCTIRRDLPFLAIPSCRHLLHPAIHHILTIIISIANNSGNVTSPSTQAQMESQRCIAVKSTISYSHHIIVTPCTFNDIWPYHVWHHSTS